MLEKELWQDEDGNIFTRSGLLATLKKVLKCNAFGKARHREQRLVWQIADVHNFLGITLYGEKSSKWVSCCMNVWKKVFNKFFLGARLRGRTLQGGILGTFWKLPFLRTLLRTLFYCKSHSRPPSQNPSENPSPEPFPEPSQNPS